MFIVVHQIDELWFKLILREMVSVRDLFARAPVPEQALASAVRGIRRMETILHQLAAHFALMETMTTRDYLGVPRQAHRRERLPVGADARD